MFSILDSLLTFAKVAKGRGLLWSFYSLSELYCELKANYSKAKLLRNDFCRATGKDKDLSKVGFFIFGLRQKIQ
jgi:hypothetical protein